MSAAGPTGSLLREGRGGPDPGGTGTSFAVKRGRAVGTREPGATLETTERSGSGELARLTSHDGPAFGSGRTGDADTRGGCTTSISVDGTQTPDADAANGTFRGPEPDHVLRCRERWRRQGAARRAMRWVVSADHHDARTAKSERRRPGSLELDPPTPRRRTSRSNPRDPEGSRDSEPHGCEWLKQVTESGGDQTVKVVRNGAGGAAREWNPATRRGVGGPEQSGSVAGDDALNYRREHRLGLVGIRIPRIERIAGAVNPTGVRSGTEHGGRAPWPGPNQELQMRSSRVRARP